MTSKVRRHISVVTSRRLAMMVPSHAPGAYHNNRYSNRYVHVTSLEPNRYIVYLLVYIQYILTIDLMEMTNV